MRTLLKIISIIFGFLVIIAFILALSYTTGIFAGYPIGLDTFAHAYKANFIESYFPDIFWSHQWAQGMPIFLWYAPFPYFLIVLGNLLSGSMLLSLTWLPVIAVILAFLGVFLLTFEVTKSTLLGIAMAFLGAANSTIWARLYMGEIPRIIATAFWPLAIWVAVRIIKRKGLPLTKNRLNWLFTWFVISLAFQGHFIFAAVTFISILAIIWFGGGKLLEKIKLAIKIMLPPLAVAAYVLLPFTASQFNSQIYGEDFFGKIEQYPISIESLFSYPFTKYFPEKFGQGEGHWGGGLTSFLLPLTAAVIILLIGKRLFIKSKTKHFFLSPLFLIALGSFLFGAISLIKPTLVYYNGALPPIDSYYFMAIALPLFLGPAIGYIFQKGWLRIPIALSIIAIVSYSSYHQYPPQGIYAKIFANTHLEELVKESKLPLLIENKSETNYRFSSDEAEIAIWYNWIYDKPTTRDYYSQGILNQDWRFLYENAIFNWQDNPEQTAFLLDWFAVDDLRVAGRHLNGDKFRKQPELYEEIAQIGVTGGLFRVINPSPIISATNVPTMLLIGHDISYIFRSLTYSDLNSQKLITIVGRDNLDKYSVDDLEKFDLVYLYQYSSSNLEQSSTMLADYVKGGGNLLVEAVNAPIQNNLTGLPDPWPTNDLNLSQMTGVWQFDDKLFKNLPNTDNLPMPEEEWKMFSSSNLKPWAQTLVSLSEKPVIIGGKLGAGQVYLTGFNLPFYVATNKGKDAPLLLTTILNKMIEGDISSAQSQINFISPHKREIIIDQPANGVLFKEVYTTNWKAQAITKGNKKKALPIYKAGPDFMYVPLNNLSQPANKVILTYHLSLVEKIGWYTTAATLIFFVFFALSPQKTLAFFINIQKRTTLFDKMGSWWDKEEE